MTRATWPLEAGAHNGRVAGAGTVATADRRGTHVARRRILTREKSNYASAGEQIELVIRDGFFAPATVNPFMAPAAQPSIEMPIRIVTVMKMEPEAARSSAIMDDQEPFASVRAFFAKMIRQPG
jgi:hypothetical protein